MDYSLLLGIHHVERAGREEAEEETESTSGDEEEEQEENESPLLLGSNSPEGISGYMNSFKPWRPGEFDPYVDVYAVQSAEGEPRQTSQALCWRRSTSDVFVLGYSRHATSAVNDCRCSQEGGVFPGPD